jgi:mRNA-degrading endonuclease RelE of RelBE toxin-antitoxin system
MTWTVRVHAEAARQLNGIPPDRRKRILDDVLALAEDSFRGLVKPLEGKEHKGKYRKVTGRYRIIFKPIHATHVVVLAILLRNERTYQ